MLNIPIKIGGVEYRLQSDFHEVNLCRRVESKENGTIWQPFLHYSHIESAMNSLLEQKVRASEATTIEQLIKEVQKAKRELGVIYSTEVFEES